ncbi:MAG: hypothetical protein WKF34_09355 [Pyrinomonadaceae bacterium]
MSVDHNKMRRPFWIPATSYYALVAMACLAFFILSWGILTAENVDAAWAVAGLSCGILFAGAIILREVVFRRARERLLKQERAMSSQFSDPPDGRNPDKLTLKKNAAALGEIKRKSDAANVLNNLSAGHREVFELCSGYLRRVENELKNVSPSSPRLTAILKGRSAAAEFHRYHMLKWAEIESRSLAETARSGETSEVRSKAVEGAISVIEAAIEMYPSDGSLAASQSLLQELAVSIRVTEYVDQAERKVFEGRYEDARSLYREALYDLGRGGVDTPGRAQAAEKIRLAMERIVDLTP